MESFASPDIESAYQQWVLTHESGAPAQKPDQADGQERAFEAGYCAGASDAIALARRSVDALAAGAWDGDLYSSDVLAILAGMKPEA